MGVSVLKKNQQLKITLVAKTTTVGAHSLRDPPHTTLHMTGASTVVPVRGPPRMAGTTSPSWQWGETGV